MSMDETIGVKGGYQDRRRTMRLQQLEKERLEELEEESIEELEKEVKKKERYALIKTIPIIIAGSIFQALVQNKGKAKDKKQKSNSSWEEIKEKAPVEEEKPKVIMVVLGDGRKVEVPIQVEKLLEEVPENVTILPDVPKRVEDHQIVVNEGYVRDQEFGVISIETKDKIEQLKGQRIIESYEKELKDIRYDLRRILFDYHVLVDEEKGIHKSEEAEALLKELSELIRKIEELKRRIRVEDYQKYDDNYIYSLIEGYLNDFKEGKAISSIKNSSMYEAISNRLSELDHQKDAFQKKVEEEKERFQDREEKYAKLKEKASKFKQMKQEFMDFQTQQERLLREVQEKVENSVSVSERVKVEAEAMSVQSKRLMRLLAFSMIVPGVRAAKQTAYTTAVYLYLVKQIMNPKLVKKKYKIVEVSDYSSEIESSIRDIERTSKQLAKTSDEIQKMLETIKLDFKDYIGVYPECDELIRNLESIREDILEREYEIQKIKEAQKKELEKNEAKVLTKGEYPM